CCTAANIYFVVQYCYCSARSAASKFSSAYSIKPVISCRIVTVECCRVFIGAGSSQSAISSAIGYEGRTIRSGRVGERFLLCPVVCCSIILKSLWFLLLGSSGTCQSADNIAFAAQLKCHSSSDTCCRVSFFCSPFIGCGVILPAIIGVKDV